ncbi:transposase [Nitrosomonas sp.]|uniref:REP-associated tyrosine transposase n=1 Tax=Nitrosomonas sp. TaxID=42353 RepID=UPI0027307077|nr:transposase [Nitrosomonas sp.]MDP1785734.1 transposase [Nitrosomonas sp.]
MAEYRRAYVPGGSWFFTVNLAERKNNRLLVEKIDLLRSAFEYTKQRYPFRLDAVIILPDHLHCIWTLPQADADFSTRWKLLKGYFSRHIAKGEGISASPKSRRERGIWQRRFWEHLLRDQNDFNRHVDYIHWNPVKHGWAKRVSDWPYSSFHRYVEQGVYPENWGNHEDYDIEGLE